MTAGNRDRLGVVQICMRFAILCIGAAATAGCASDAASSTRPPPSTPAQVPATAELDESSIVEADPQDSAVVTPCDGFKERYVGEGLFVPLPAAAIGLSGTSTADPGPIHAATSTDFDLGDNVVVTLGRRISSDVVIFVEADEAALHRCLLESARYDPARDQAD